MTAVAGVAQRRGLSSAEAQERLRCFGAVSSLDRTAGWAARMLVGSVTERLLNHLPTSLVVVPMPVADAFQSAAEGAAVAAA